MIVLQDDKKYQKFLKIQNKLVKGRIKFIVQDYNKLIES